MKTVTLAFLSVLSSACPLEALAHHSARVAYDMNRVVEFQGTITTVAWQNPHVRFGIRTLDAEGEPVDWNVESIPVTRLARVGITPELFNIGDTITVAGFPPRRPVRDFYAINLLLQDGREVLLDTPEPRWTNNTIGTGRDETPGTAGADPALGIFRVWSTDGSLLATETRFLTEGGDLAYPLTDRARAAQAVHDPLTPGNPFLGGCTPKGMPLIMQQPNPIEFIDKGDWIELRMEEYDTVREISLPERVLQERQVPTLLGHSFGHWEGNTLVVETGGISWPYFDQWGLMQSEAMQTVERFTLDAAGSKLDYELIVTDPALFTEPVTLTKSWRWIPGDQVLPFNCIEE